MAFLVARTAGGTDSSSPTEVKPGYSYAEAYIPWTYGDYLGNLREDVGTKKSLERDWDISGQKYSVTLLPKGFKIRPKVMHPPPMTDKDWVSLIQVVLAVSGYRSADLAPTGKLDAQTKKDLYTFQVDQGLPQSSVLDQATWDRLQAVYHAVAKAEAAKVSATEPSVSGTTILIGGAAVAGLGLLLYGLLKKKRR